MITILPMRSLIYTSRPTRPLTEEDLVALGHTARTLNSLDGITGLLLCTPTHFHQLLEGSAEAIDALLVRLRADDRHADLTIIHDRTIDMRSTSGWDMKIVKYDTVQQALVEGGATVLTQLDATSRQILLTAIAA